MSANFDRGSQTRPDLVRKTLKQPQMCFRHIGYAIKDTRSYLDDFLHVTDPVAGRIQQVTVCFVGVAGGALSSSWSSR